MNLDDCGVSIIRSIDLKSIYGLSKDWVVTEKGYLYKHTLIDIECYICKNPDHGFSIEELHKLRPHVGVFYVITFGRAIFNFNLEDHSGLIQVKNEAPFQSAVKICNIFMERMTS